LPDPALLMKKVMLDDCASTAAATPKMRRTIDRDAEIFTILSIPDPPVNGSSSMDSR